MERRRVKPFEYKPMGESWFIVENAVVVFGLHTKKKLINWLLATFRQKDPVKYKKGLNIVSALFEISEQ